MEISSIKLRFKKRNVKRIDIKAKGYKDVLSITSYNNILCFPNVNEDDLSKLREIGYQCYYWLTTDDKQLDDYTEIEWNKWIDRFKRKVGFKNEYFELLARNSINTYKSFIK